MAASQIIPSIFTAVDRFTQPMRNMINAMSSFTASATRAQRSLSFMSTGMGRTMDRVFDYGAIFSIAGAVAFAAKSVADFDSEIANLGALTGLNGDKLEEFRGRIIDIARDVKANSVDVAKGFTLVANQMPELLKDVDGLSNVSRASIVLSRAARVSLEESAEALTGVLNNFALGAEYSAKAIDVLAMASRVGSSEIKDTTEALSKFGSLAHNVAGATFEESVALVELVSKFEKGALAGDKLRNILIRLSTAPVLEAKAMADLSKFGVNTKFVADKTQTLYARLKELSKIGTSASALKNVFDAENVNLASALLSNLDKMPELLSQLKDQSEGAAIAMAKMNQNTFYGALERFKGKFVTELTASSGAGRGMQFLVNMLNFAESNMNGLLTTTLLLVGAMGSLKLVTMITTGAMSLFKGVMFATQLIHGFMAVKTGNLNGALLTQQWYARGATLAMGGYKVAIASTLGIVGLLATAFMLLSSKTDDSTASIENYKDGVRQLNDPLNKETIGVQAYNDAVAEHEAAKNLMQKAQYHFDKGNLFKYAYSKASLALSYPLDYSFNKDIEAPKMSDYVSDTSNVQKQYLPGYTPPANNTEVNVHVNVDKDGGHTVTKNIGSIPVNVSSTSNLWTSK